MSLVPWAAQKESECSSSVTKVGVESRQSKAVTVLDLKHLEAKLAGDLSAGYLALKFTGEPLRGLFTQTAYSLQINLSQAQHPA